MTSSILIGAIADDLTGATDLALMLARNGMKTVQVIGVPVEGADFGDAEAVVIALKSRTIAANDRGYECLLIEDATESYFPAFKAATIDMIIAQGGIVGWVAPLAALQHGLAQQRARPAAAAGEASAP